jgi:hypothetical protein
MPISYALFLGIPIGVFFLLHWQSDLANHVWTF